VKHAPREIRKIPKRVRSVPRIVQEKIPGVPNPRSSRHQDDRRGQSDNRDEGENEDSNTQVMSRRSRGREEEDDGYASEEVGFDGLLKGRPGFPPGDGFLPGDEPFLKGQRSRSGKGADDDTYESTQYGPRSSTARDGYQRDGVSDAYEERAQGFGDAPVRGQGYARGYEQPIIPYQRRRRSSADFDRDVYYERRRTEKRLARSRSRSRFRAGPALERAKSKLKEAKEERHYDGAENSTEKKWAATLAGAAVGGFAGHTAKKDNWVPAALGAIVGGLVAREGEKEFYRQKERKELEKKKRRSMSR
jgi:hypothetical protein